VGIDKQNKIMLKTDFSLMAIFGCWFIRITSLIAEAYEFTSKISTL